MITYQAHMYTNIRYTFLQYYDCATDRSQWRAARRIFFVFRPISSTRQFFCPMCRINASASCSVSLCILKVTVLRNYVSQNHCIIFRRSHLISFALSTNDGVDAGFDLSTVRRSHTSDDCLSTWNGNEINLTSTFASYNQSANVVADFSRYIA